MALKMMFQLPKRATELMGETIADVVYYDMVESLEIELIKLQTFGMIITPIVQEIYGKPIGYVCYWHNGAYTVHLCIPDDTILEVIGIHEQVDVLLSVDAIVKLFETDYYRLLEAMRHAGQS